MNENLIPEGKVPHSKYNIPKQYIARANLQNKMGEGLVSKCEGLTNNSRSIVNKYLKANTIPKEVVSELQGKEEYLARQIILGYYARNFLYLNPTENPELKDLISDYPLLFDEKRPSDEPFLSSEFHHFSEAFNQGGFYRGSGVFKYINSDESEKRLAGTSQVYLALRRKPAVFNNLWQSIQPRVVEEEQQALNALKALCQSRGPKLIGDQNLVDQMLGTYNTSNPIDVKKYYYYRLAHCQLLKKGRHEQSTSLKVPLSLDGEQRLVSQKMSKIAEGVSYKYTDVKFLGKAPLPGSCWTTAHYTKKYTDFDDSGKSRKGHYSCEYECITPKGQHQRLRGTLYDEVSKYSDDGRYFLCESYKNPGALQKQSTIREGRVGTSAVYSTNGKTGIFDPRLTESPELLEWAKEHLPPLAKEKDSGWSLKKLLNW